MAILTQGTVGIGKSKIKKFLDAYFLFLIFTCIYFIKYRFDLIESLFPKRVKAMPIISKLLKTFMSGKLVKYIHQYNPY